MVDVDRVLKNTVKNGRVVIGAKQTKQAITDGAVKIIVMSANCPAEMELSTLAKKKDVPLYKHGSKSVDMGYACGKTFPVSVLAVLEEGGSNIMQLVKKGSKHG